MLKKFQYTPFFKKIQKSLFYSRLRQHFPMSPLVITDDRDSMAQAERVEFPWPGQVTRPLVGIVQDTEKTPRWTKYCRFLETNGIPYEIYDIHAHDWQQKAEKFDVILGFTTNALYNLDESRRKYHFLETYLHKACYPSSKHAFLYEDKALEAFVAQACGAPFIRSYISHSFADAMRLSVTLQYPLVSKINPSSGSLGVQLVTDQKSCQKIIRQAFSQTGRKIFTESFRQKNYVYFQDYVACDGYDIRAMVVGNRIFGYYRKVLPGDFRASGMNMEVEKRALPPEAMRIAWQLNQTVQSPMLIVDMLHGLDDRYYIIEYSPVCQMDSPEQLHVDGIPGAYVMSEDGSIHFEPGKYWLHELALEQFFLKDYLPPRLMRG